MKSILTILTAVVLLTSSLMFSSCKNCNEDKNKGKDGGKNNLVTDRDKDKDNPDTDKDKDDPDNPAADGDGDASVLDGIALAEVEKHLRDHGASDGEIEATRHIAIEHFGNNIGHIMWDNNHYWYRDDMGDHDGKQTLNNCGLYAMKRLLFALGRHGIVDKNLWYQYTDDELRCYFEKKWYGKDVVHREYNPVLAPGFVSKLMMELGVKDEYYFIYDRYSNQVPLDLPVPPLTLEETAAANAKADGIKARLQILKERATVILNLVRAEGVTKANIDKAINDIEAVIRDIDNISEELNAWGDKIVDEYLLKAEPPQHRDARKACGEVRDEAGRVDIEIREIRFTKGLF